jgi:hypothetical protein
LSQRALAEKAKVGLSTLDALENARLGELGFTKVTNLLATIGLELKLPEANARRRPMLDELTEEQRHDEDLGRRR